VALNPHKEKKVIQRGKKKKFIRKRGIYQTKEGRTTESGGGRKRNLQRTKRQRLKPPRGVLGRTEMETRRRGTEKTGQKGKGGGEMTRHKRKKGVMW